jgi:hypothetical protein
LFFGAHIAGFDISFGFMISQKMLPDIYVFGTGMLYWVVGKLDGTLIVTKEWDFVILTTKISQGLPHPKQLSAKSTSSNVFGFGGGKRDTILFFRAPRH